MAHYWFILAALLNLYMMLKGEDVTSDTAWSKLCPVICSCHFGHFGDLPINHWLHSEESKMLKQSPSKTNEAFYEGDTSKGDYVLQKERGALLKIAICIFQSKSDPETYLQKLPSDIQALSILQGRDSQEIVLEEQHMQHFQQLIYLDIQGYCLQARKDDVHEHTTNKSIAISNNILKPLKSLQYLSLQHVHILGSSIQSNKIDHEGQSVANVDSLLNEISIVLQSGEDRKVRKHPKGRIHKLSFATPYAVDNDLLSYKEYKKEQEWARLSTFAKLSNLVYLQIIDCGLHEVYWEMFEGMGKLEYLSLEKNQLLFLPEFAFYGTPNLKVLSLAHNKLLNIQSTGLAGLLELQKLDLSHNKFSHLTEFSLPPFPKLETANFRHNPIEAVFASTFEIMNATTTLYLGGNDSTLALHPNSFLGLNQLRKLVLFNVGVDLLERQLLNGMPQLKELDITGTINAISFDAFLDVPMLEKLILHGCKIKSLSMDAFYGLYKLLYLDLSHNMLEVLPPGVFDQQFSLRELYLQNNMLTELPDGFFATLPAKMVRLEGNLWHCTCTMKDWQPSATNRIKEVKGPLCQPEYDKGMSCRYVSNYIYDRKVAPTCATPIKYKGWNIYHVIRKELQCTKKHQKRFNRLEYLKKKHKEYEQNTGHHNKDINSNNMSTSTEFHKKKTDKKLALETKTSTLLMQQNFTTPYVELSLSNKTVVNKSLVPDTKREKINNTETFESKNENIIPLIPVLDTQVQYNDAQIPNHVPQQSNKKHTASQNKNTVASHTGKKDVKENVDNEYRMTDEDYAKKLKKVWKNDLQRKHQEKLRKYQSH